MKTSRLVSILMICALLAAPVGGQSPQAESGDAFVKYLDDMSIPNSPPDAWGVRDGKMYCRCIWTPETDDRLPWVQMYCIHETTIPYTQSPLQRFDIPAYNMSSATKYYPGDFPCWVRSYSEFGFYAHPNAHQAMTARGINFEKWASLPDDLQGLDYDDFAMRMISDYSMGFAQCDDPHCLID